MGEREASEKRIAAVERQARAINLRKAGAGYEVIARELGYAGPSGAHKAVATALRAVFREPARELVDLELARLDALLAGLWADACKGNVAKIDRVLKIMARRAALLGLDAPTRLVVGEAELDAAATRLAAKTGRDKATLLAELRARTAAIERARQAG